MRHGLRTRMGMRVWSIRMCRPRDEEDVTDGDGGQVSSTSRAGRTDITRGSSVPARFEGGFGWYPVASTCVTTMRVWPVEEYAPVMPPGEN
jgi:hypothetical protein